MYHPSMKARMDDLERQKTSVILRLAETPMNVPDFHPNIANAYRLRIEQFAEALDNPDGGRQAAEALRTLIGEIVLTPGANEARFTPSYAASCLASSNSRPKKTDHKPNL